MKLEVGKYYRSNNGEVVHIVYKSERDFVLFVSNLGVRYTEGGRLFSDIKTVYDLVYEVTDPILKFFTPPRVELLSISAIEAAAGIPSRTLYKFLKGTRGLPKKHRAPLIEILKKVGYDG